MNEPVEKAQIAWQPLTMRGVAAFAGASFARLLLVQFIVALFAAGSVVWFLHQAWFPTIGDAIRQLPPQGELRSGRLDWHGPTPLRCKVFSLFGCMRCAYPPRWAAAFNRAELGPWWGAWAPAILAIVAVLVVGGLMLSWAILATVYFLPAWLAGFFANRDLSLPGSWRLAGAALMPGALLLSAVVVLYGWGALDLVLLAISAAVHLVMGWVYLCVSPLSLPRRQAAGAKENPFA